MAGTRLTPKEIEIITIARSKGALCREIVAELAQNGYHRTLSSVTSYIGRAQVDGSLLPDKVENVIIPPIIQVGKDHRVEPKYKVIFLSDLHIPFHDDYVIRHVIENHSDADALVLGGDILDAYSVSKWPKRQNISFASECKSAKNWLSALGETFKTVVAISGNHDDRFNKNLSSQLSADVRELMDTEILSVITSNNDNVIYNAGHANWFTRIGECILAHPSAYSKIQLRTAESVRDFFLNKRIDFDCIVIGHLHKISYMIRASRLYIESGAACLPMQYEYNPRLLYREPIASGYTIVHMDDQGSVAFNETRPVYLGTKTLDPGAKIELS